MYKVNTFRRDDKVTNLNYDCGFNFFFNYIGSYIPGANYLVLMCHFKRYAAKVDELFILVTLCSV